MADEGLLRVGFSAVTAGELSVPAGAKVHIIKLPLAGEQVPDGWLFVRYGQREGFVPANHIAVMKAPPGRKPPPTPDTMFADYMAFAENIEPGDPDGDLNGAGASSKSTFAMEANALRVRLNAKRKVNLIDPRTSRLMGYWDALTSLALLYTALLTPAEVALLDPALSPLEPLFLVNRTIDVIFLIDICLQFVLITEVTRAQSQGAYWLTTPREIARQYLHTWFTIDLISTAVAAFDFIGLSAFNSSGDQNSNLSSLKVLRVIRVVRLIKLVRLLRASRMIRRWETRIAINYATLALVKALVSVILLGHWMACAWSMQARIQSDLSQTWLGRLGYCTPIVDDDATSAVEQLWSCPPLDIYVAALYFAAATITSIGYGDITPTLSNTTEVFMAAVLMFSSCVVWAHLIGVFSSILANFSPERNAFRAEIDQLNRFIKAEAMPKELARRMREYLHQSKHLRSAQIQQRLLSALPPALQGEVSWITNQSWLPNISFLQGAEPQFMLELSLQLHAVVFAPSNLAPKNFLFIMQRGVAIYRGKVLTKGGVWGEDIVLETVALRSKETARALNYVAAYYISRDELLILAKKFPLAARVIRKYAINLALRRQIVTLARAVQASGGKADLRSVMLKNDLFETVAGAMMAKRYLESTGDSDGVDDNPETMAGGRLAGYSDNVAVQFDIMGHKLNDIKAEMRETTGALTDAITQLRFDLGLRATSNGSAAAHEPPKTVNGKGMNFWLSA